MRCHCCSNGIFCVSTVHIKDSTPGSTVPAVNETTQLMPSRTGKSYIDRHRDGLEADARCSSPGMRVIMTVFYGLPGV